MFFWLLDSHWHTLTLACACSFVGLMACYSFAYKNTIEQLLFKEVTEQTCSESGIHTID